MNHKNKEKGKLGPMPDTLEEFVENRIMRSGDIYNDFLTVMKEDKTLRSVNCLLHSVQDATMMLMTGMMAQVVGTKQADPEEVIESMVGHMHEWIDNFEKYARKIDLVNYNACDDIVRNEALDKLFDYMYAMAVQSYKEIKQARREMEFDENEDR